MRRSSLVLVLLSMETLAHAQHTAQPDATAILGLRAPPALLRQLPLLSQELRFGLEEADVEVPTTEELRVRRDRALSSRDEERMVLLRQRARQHFLEFEFEADHDTLAEARSLMRSHFFDLLGDSSLGVVELELARVLLNLDRLDEALTLLVEVTRDTPTLRPSHEDFGAQLMAEWTRIQAGEELNEAVASEVTRPEPPNRLVEAGRRIGVSFVITGGLLRLAPESYELRLQRLDVESGEVTGEVVIALGNERTWRDALAPPLRQLVGTPEPEDETEGDRPEARGSLLVLSTPPGAQITVDNRLEEGVRTPANLDVTPGLHSIELTLDEHHPARAIVNAWANQTRPVELALEPRVGLGRRFWWAWTLIGVVTSAIVSTVAVLAVRSSRERPDAVIDFRQALALEPE